MVLSDYKGLLRNLVAKFNGINEASLKDSDNERHSKDGDSWFWVQAFPTISESVHFEIQECGEAFVLVFHNELHGNSWAKRRYQEELEGVPARDLKRHFLKEEELKYQFECMSKVVRRLMKNLSDCYKILTSANEANINEEELTIEEVNAKEILKWNLFIPQYQRGYEWSRRNILDFLDDIWNWRKDHKVGDQYHVGTVILRASREGWSNKSVGLNCEWAIVDGQQRLTTLSLLRYVVLGSEYAPPLLKAKRKFLTLDDKAHLIWGNTIIHEWVGSHDKERELLESLFDCISLSVVKIPYKAEQQVEFKFFSSINSLGKRLSDYDLIKAHHLRYINDDQMATMMSALWHRLELSKDNALSVLFNETLYRLRVWRCGLPLRLDAEGAEDRPLYKHFSVEIDSVSGYADSDVPVRFDSFLPGGASFFKYVEKYRSQFEAFVQEPVINKLRSALGGHSSGVLLSGIMPIVFLFYCKFGKLYLNDAVYAIVYRISVLRNEAHVKSSYLRTKSIFSECVTNLDRMISESMFVAHMLNPKRDYSITNKNSPTAKSYWNSVWHLLGELEKQRELLISIPNNLFKARQFEVKNEQK